ncbi:MAG: hypothetical protein LBQ79_10475, partial [Deltaproteobacteria bacterium]|nr:hypothetical protein [Deltaproteobacteria bacterium]
MSDELTAFLNFTFMNRQVNTKVVDDNTYRVTTAVRWQLNWADYSSWLAENGVCTDPELRPSLRRYAAPQPTESLYDDLVAFQSETRRTARQIIASRRVPPELWKRILRETEGYASVMTPGPGFEGEITPENVNRLKLSYTYDTPAYRGAIMAVMRDLITSGDIFRLKEDAEGLFSLSGSAPGSPRGIPQEPVPAPSPEPASAPTPASRRKEAIPLKEALSRATGRLFPLEPPPPPTPPPAEPRPREPVTFSLMSELSDEDIMAALSSPPDDEPLALTETVTPGADSDDSEPLALTEALEPPELPLNRTGPSAPSDGTTAAPAERAAMKDGPVALPDQTDVPGKEEEPAALTAPVIPEDEPVALTELADGADGEPAATLTELADSVGKEEEQAVTLTELAGGIGKEKERAAILTDLADDVGKEDERAATLTEPAIPEGDPGALAMRAPGADEEPEETLTDQAGPEDEPIALTVRDAGADEEPEETLADQAGPEEETVALTARDAGADEEPTATLTDQAGPEEETVALTARDSDADEEPTATLTDQVGPEEETVVLGEKLDGEAEYRLSEDTRASQGLDEDPAVPA